MFLRVALPTPLRRLFDYLPPLDESAESISKLKAGCRIAVAFGPRPMVGILIEVAHISEIAKDKLRPALNILDREPIIPVASLDLFKWAADYYHHSLGDVLQNALPAWLRQVDRQDIDSQAGLQITATGRDTDPSSLKSAKKQAALLSLLQHSDQPLTETDIIQHGFARNIINGLLEKQLIQSVRLPLAYSHSVVFGEPLKLNQEQQLALDTISKGAHCTLLAGITGSGKTEVYLQAIESSIKQGKQALVLVPEIGLTPQTLQRFEARFGPCVKLIHSACSDGERLATWLAAKDGAASIIIGTRSAIFTPLAKPGIIIVDEEHDASFKQQDGFRYSARDLAVVRAAQESIPVVLGSATPSLESLANVKAGRYQIAKLNQRAGNANPPVMRTIDLRHQKLNNGFSPESLFALRRCLDKGQQALVFINRRGYAPVLMCHDCGWYAQCQHCEARMTTHLRPAHLHCHHCDNQQRLPNSCPSCRSRQMVLIGQGTERSEEALQAEFPHVDVLRIDRDTTSRKTAMSEMLDQIQQGKPCIMVGTQMLAKGHHFPKLGLVLILDADGGLFSADFRGPEKMAQLLIQVAGRAGREDLAGEVLIQSHQPDHPQLQLLLQRGYFHFASELLQLRQVQQLPPATAMAMVRVSANKQDSPEAFLEEVILKADQLNQTGIKLMGPLPAPMPKRAGKFRAQLHIQANNKSILKNFLNVFVGLLETTKGKDQLHWSLDVDPIDMF